ncbi:MAG: hypothetical protein M9954_12435 [Cyclobacteriaceae bacterium]|nr:hypothetical protein [Cyclobacteriaceae bacterium]MCB0500836.1 hypothetical protein [Cyclobacteriaceae bacterium]MCB9239215.1 hypothetical protein [Flammeovirgaceae bacterium]MCO5272459.1 hypothetical protein [Cyclobacteriaceae bacterium]MCW5903352.1 hypothetical protein [Cyclobacteriaceae bacterium]
MKKLMMMAATLLMPAGMAFAQTGIGMEKVKKVKQEEVPAIVQFSLHNEFNLSPESGTWSLQYLKSSNGVGKPALFKPVAYTFHQKKDGNKIEIRFSPEGALERSKGIDKTESPVTGK